MRGGRFGLRCKSGGEPGSLEIIFVRAIEIETPTTMRLLTAKKGKMMSNKTRDILEPEPGTTSWDRLLEEMREEYWDDEELTEEEKRFLDELERLPEEQWEPVPCPGKPLSEIIIEERGA